MRRVFSIYTLLIASITHGQENIISITQGTNIAIAISPNKEILALDLMGQLWEMPSIGGLISPLTPPTFIARNPKFSPDGKKLVYQRQMGLQWDLWLTDLDAHTHYQLTNTNHNETDPHFSANGNWVIFTSSLTGNNNIWRKNIETGQLEQLTSETGNANFPAVSERNEIAYVVENSGNWSLKLLQNSGSVELYKSKYPLSSPSWRPTGGVIIFNERPSIDESNLAMILLDTEPIRKTLTRQEDVFAFSPGWLSPDEFVYAADGGIWRRRIADTRRNAIPFFGHFSIERSSGSQNPSQRQQRKHIPDNTDHYAIQVDRLYDGVRNKYRRYMDIHVHGAYISAVAPRGTQPLPDKVIDARDYTLIPGLIDLHAHSPDISTRRAGRAWLAYGITTLRELVTNQTELADGLQRKSAWSTSTMPGPRLLLTGPTRKDLETFSIKQVSEYDAFQLYSGYPVQLIPEKINAVKEWGLPIFAEALFPNIHFGVNGIEKIGNLHKDPYSLHLSGTNKTYQDVLSILTSTRTKMIPMIVASGGFQSLANNAESWKRDSTYITLFSSSERGKWENAVENIIPINTLQTFVTKLVAAGGRIGIASNTPHVPYGLGLHAELTLLANAGLSNDQVLRFATAESAAALGLDNSIGTIEPGKLADFVVLTGNPLTRIQDTLSIEAVVKEGEWIYRKNLLYPP